MSVPKTISVDAIRKIDNITSEITLIMERVLGVSTGLRMISQDLGMTERSPEAYTFVALMEACKAFSEQGDAQTEKLHEICRAEERRLKS